MRSFYECHPGQDCLQVVAKALQRIQGCTMTIVQKQMKRTSRTPTRRRYRRYWTLVMYIYWSRVKSCEVCERQPVAPLLSLSAAPPSLRRALPASSHAVKCCPNSHRPLAPDQSSTAQHGRSLDRQKQLLPRSLTLQPLLRGAGSFEGLLHHLICAIEPATRKLCAQSQPPCDHF
jgi:hypothetical protein